MKQQNKYWIEADLADLLPIIEMVTANDASAAHRVVYKKYDGQYVASTILGNTPQSKLVYIASPYAGDIAENTQFAIRCCRYAIQRGYTPIAPHLLYQQMLDDAVPEERALALTLGHNLLNGCDAMWVCGERISSGMAGEIAYAESRGIPIRYIPKINELEVENHGTRNERS